MSFASVWSLGVVEVARRGLDVRGSGFAGGSNAREEYGFSLMEGNEAWRVGFGKQLEMGLGSGDGACVDNEAGNVAEGETIVAGVRRVTQVTDRRTSFAGGVGGVDIHVGGGRCGIRTDADAGKLGLEIELEAVGAVK